MFGWPAKPVARVGSFRVTVLCRGSPRTELFHFLDQLQALVIPGVVERAVRAALLDQGVTDPGEDFRGRLGVAPEGRDPG